jgi:hypothetical protein
MVRSYVPQGKRVKQLWITGTLGAPGEWQPTQQTWRRLERAYGGKFDDELRADIEKAVQRYFDWVRAPPASQFLRNLQKARNVAEELRNVVVSFGEAGSLIAPHWERYFPRESTDDSDAPLGDDDAALFEWVMSIKSQRRGRDHRCFDEVIATICSALDDLWRETSHRGETANTPSLTWNQLVLDLGRAFKRRALKVSARKRGDGLSPFVKLVGELQTTLPKELRFHETDAALSQAVYQVLHPEKQNPNPDHQFGP